MTETIAARDIRLTRVLDAPRELVWQAWTEPDQLARWWGNRGWNVEPSTMTMDVRPGGELRLTSISEQDGAEMTQEGVYREVVELERLVFEEPAKGNWHAGAVSVVTFTELGDGRTELECHTTINTTDEMRAMAEAGIASSLERLAEHVG